MSEHVGCDPLAGQGGTGRAGSGRVLGQARGDGVAAHPGAGAGGEHDVGAVGEAGGVGAQDCDGLCFQRGDAVLAALSAADDVGRASQVQVDNWNGAELTQVTSLRN